MNLKQILTLSILTLLGWLGLTQTIKFTQAYTAQQQALSQAPALVTEFESGKQAANLDALKQRQKQAQETIAVLAAVPNLPGLNYDKAQLSLTKLYALVSHLTQQIQVEEQAAADFNAAQPLAAEAQKLVETPPYPAEVWQQTRDKWQQAISLLEKIPEGTFVSEQAMEGLAVTRHNDGVMKQYFAVEKTAVQNIDAAMTAADEAASLTQSQPYQLVDLMKAQSQWLQAIKLLSQIAPTTTVSQDALGFLPVFRRNFQSVNEALEQVKTCTKARNGSETLCGYEASVALEMPTAEVAAEEDVEDEETVAFNPEMTTYLSPGIPGRYRRSRAGSSGSTYVRGYTRSDGTQVRGYTRGSGTRASGFGSSRSGGASS